MFNKFKKCNDQEIYNAAMMTCLQCDHLIATYVFHKKKLVVAFEGKDYGRQLTEQELQNTLNVLKTHLPEKYKDSVVVWPIEKWRDVPGKIQNTTGIFHKWSSWANRI